MKIILIMGILMILFFVGCAHTEKVNAKFTQLINEQSNKSSDLLKLDGAYHHISQESYHYPVDYKNGVPTRYIDSPYLEQPLFFFSDGIVLHEFNTTTLEADDFDPPMDNESNVFYKKGGWGVFSIKKDTVNAVIFINFIKGLFIASNDNLQCNFQGVFKNADTILSWHLVPPFPPIKRIPMNIGLLEFLQKPIDLYFKTVPEKKYINPNNAWINKYRKINSIK